MNVDIGGGSAAMPNTDVILDKHKYNDKVVVCNVGFDPLPFKDETVDKFTAKDLLEHIPRVDPVIYLFNEIWRCLKPGGTFESITPVYPNEQVFQDPTHVSVWTMGSMNYFCKGYNDELKPAYGIKCKFEMLKNEKSVYHLHSILKKPE